MRIPFVLAALTLVPAPAVAQAAGPATAASRPVDGPRRVSPQNAKVFLEIVEMLQVRSEEQLRVLDALDLPAEGKAAARKVLADFDSQLRALARDLKSDPPPLQERIAQAEKAMHQVVPQIRAAAGERVADALRQALDSPREHLRLWALEARFFVPKILELDAGVRARVEKVFDDALATADKLPLTPITIDERTANHALAQRVLDRLYAELTPPQRSALEARYKPIYRSGILKPPATAPASAPAGR